MIPYDVKMEIKSLVKKYLDNELAELKKELGTLKEDNTRLKVEIDILKEGGNI